MLLISIVFVVLMVVGMPVAFATAIAGFVFFVCPPATKSVCPTNAPAMNYIFSGIAGISVRFTARAFSSQESKYTYA